MVTNNLSLCDEIQAGRLKYYIQSWKTITEDHEILETVTGVKLDFPEGPPSCSTNYNIGFSKVEENAIDDEIKKLLAKQAIAKYLHEEGEYISPIFVCLKHDGTYRLMLNLKPVNLESHHTKLLFSLHRFKGCILYSTNTSRLH